jgi:exopolyphosphatase/guanosine-5'-triphosphate,3'-diphosphate pyrophosphatase
MHLHGGGVVTVHNLKAMGKHSDIYRDSKRTAIIDMGSNSWRLIVVEYVPGLSFKVVDEVRESVRIGEGMAELNVLRPAAMDRAARVAQIYAAFCKTAGITDIVAVATSAIRDARNQARFLERIARESGIEPRVLSGEEEAYYAYLAAVNSTTLENGIVLDLGGGSLEIVRVEGRRPTRSVSFPLGAVRMTEGYLHSDPVTAKELNKLTSAVRETFKSLEWLRAEDDFSLIGEGGTLRQIARLAQKRLNYPLDILHGYTVPIGQISSIKDELAKLSVSARRRLLGMKIDRADISLAGAVVIHEAMRTAGFDAITICSQGLREGLFYERFLSEDNGNGRPIDHSAPPMFADVRRASVLNLCHLYRFQEQHAQHIARLTLSMFDQLPAELHDCGPVERELLWAASMVHDIGVTVDYHDHHKHGSYLVLNAGLPGFSHREIALIALLVRYHRKGRPTPDELASVLGPGDDRRLVQLCALLRLAEQIDRARDGTVHDVELTVSGGRARMALLYRGDEQVALWAVEHHREIFEQAFGVELEFIPVPDEDEV